MQESLEASLVRIRSANGRVVGAGFLVGERHILTCAHVITKALGLADDTADKPSSLVSLDFPRLASHTLLTARVVFWSPVQDDGRGDIAGLELLDKPPAGTEAVHFAPSEQVWGHPYRAFGFPAGQDDGVWSDGCLLARQGINWIQLEDDKIPGFAVIAGFSGAPVWDEQLQGVVGMIVASSQPATTKTAFAIPSDMLIASWPQLASLMRPLAACRRERNRSHASRSASACVVDGTSRSTRKERDRRQNRDGDGGPMTWKEAPAPALRPG